MSSVTYPTSMSLDGRITGPDGSFDRSVSDEELAGTVGVGGAMLAAHPASPAVRLRDRGVCWR